MQIDVEAPCCLPLGLARFETADDSRVGLLGVTLQHPPLKLSARSSAAGINVTGARARLAHAQATRFLEARAWPQAAEVEIELATPAHMGLGSEAMLGLSLARALSLLHQPSSAVDDAQDLARAVGLGAEGALPRWGFQNGGCLLVDVTLLGSDASPPLVRRQEIAHADADAWVFVLVLPRVPPGTAESLEADHVQALLSAAPALSAETGRFVDEALWPAMQPGDPVAFGRACMKLQELNHEARARAGHPVALSDEAQATLGVMREHGALAWGQSPSGLALFGLVRGVEESHRLRKKLRDHVGVFGGTVMATITDNVGARHEAKA